MPTTDAIGEIVARHRLDWLQSAEDVVGALHLPALDLAGRAFHCVDAAEIARAKLTRQIEKAAADFEKTVATLVEARDKLAAEAAALDAQIANAHQARAWLTAPGNVLGPLSGQIRDAQDAANAATKAIDPAGRYLRDAAARTAKAQGLSLIHI